MHVIYPFIVTVTCVSLSISFCSRTKVLYGAYIHRKEKGFMNRYILIKITQYCTVVGYNDT